MWDLNQLADRVHRVVQQAENDLRLEQAVYGLDQMDELQLQQLLGRGLLQYYGVVREAHYPSTVGRNLSARQRCDLVLTPESRPLFLEHREPTLFDPPNPVKPEEALWIEVKVAHQFRELEVRHGGYGAQWRAGLVGDLRKMEAEPRIRDAALLLVVFTQNSAIVEKDLELFEDLLARREVLAGFRHVRSTPILDRIGHTLCTCALWPTVQRG